MKPPQSFLKARFQSLARYGDRSVSCHPFEVWDRSARGGSLDITVAVVRGRFQGPDHVHVSNSTLKRLPEITWRPWSLIAQPPVMLFY